MRMHHDASLVQLTDCCQGRSGYQTHGVAAFFVGYDFDPSPQVTSNCGKQRICKKILLISDST